MNPADTTVESHQIQMTILRRLSGAARSRLADQFSRQIAATSIAGQRARFPCADIREDQMSGDSFFARLMAALGAGSIPMMTTGSVASSYHGEPRATFDIGIVIDPTLPQLDVFLQSGGDWYVSDEAAHQALAARGMFNIIDNTTGQKGDLIVRKDRPFSQSEFVRRRPAEILGVPSIIASAEDVILSKLEWAAISQSERQMRDALRIAEIQTTLDLDYLRYWAGELGVSQRLEEVLTAAAR